MIVEIVIIAVGLLMFVIVQTREEVDQRIAKRKHLKYLKKLEALDKDPMRLKAKLTSLERTNKEMEEELKKKNRAIQSLRLLYRRKCFALGFAQLEVNRLREGDQRSEPQVQTDNTRIDKVKIETEQRNEREQLEKDLDMEEWDGITKEVIAALNDSAPQDPKFELILL